MLETMMVLSLLYIGWSLERILRAINGVETELSTARWERGKRLRRYGGLDSPELFEGKGG